MSFLTMMSFPRRFASPDNATWYLFHPALRPALRACAFCILSGLWLGLPAQAQDEAPAPDGNTGEAADDAADAPTGGLGGADDTILPQSDALKNQRVDIADGDIPVLEFLHFLSDYSGLPVLVNTAQGGNFRNQNITITAPIKDADADIVRAILETNNFLVTRNVLPSGKEIIKVESNVQGAAAQGEPRENKVIKVEGGKAEVFGGDDTTEVDLQLQPDEIATMVFTLQFTEPTDAITALNSLISGAKTAGRSRAFSIVDVKNSMMVIITAKFGLLDYLRKLLRIIDVPIHEPDRIVQIIEVENADAEELVQVIETFLQARTGGRSNLQRRTTGTTGQNAAAAAARNRTQQDRETTLQADYRTQKIIVQTYSESELEDIHMLIRELDVRFDYRRLKTHIYQVRYLKADEVAVDIQALIGGGGTGLSGRRGLGTRGTMSSRRTGIPRTGQRGAAGGPAATTPGAAGGQQGQFPALIVPHIQTNSLLIQAEEEEYAEVLNILSKIDIKRRQVFLEAALVQVSSSSALNYTIELLAGDPDNRATRALFETSFGLSGIDLQNFNRTIPDISAPGSVPPGAFLAIQNRGKFPALITFFKTNSDSQVLATPFIVADDNMPNLVEILETRFVQLTNTVNTTTTTSQEAEDAGITLEITPTISSQNAVFLELGLTVSEFQGAAATAQVLPPKTENRISSAVTIPDGEIFVIGGLTRENRAKSVSKVPILGDIPLLGKLFRSESVSKSFSNLYIFLRAHILTDPEFRDADELTGDALEEVRKYNPELQVTNFEAPSIRRPPPPPLDPDAPRRSYQEPYSDEPESPRGPYRPVPQSTLGDESFRGSYGNGAGTVAPENPTPPIDRTDASPTSTPPPEGEDMERLIERAKRTPPALQRQGVDVDEDSDSWLVPLKRERGARRSDTPPPPVETSMNSWIGVTPKLNS